MSKTVLKNYAKFRAIDVMVAISLLAAKSSVAAPDALASTALDDGRTIYVAEGRVVISKPGGMARDLHVPVSLKQSLRTASSVVFPEAHALRAGGDDFILLVVNKPSSNSPQGYCGAGEEGDLYALGVRRNHTNVALLLPVQSCLKNIELDSDGIHSRYSSIKWRHGPAGIHIDWLSRGNSRQTSETYVLKGRVFIQQASARHDGDANKLQGVR